GAAGLVRTLPTRGVQRNLPIPEFLRVGTGYRLATPQTSSDHLEGPPPPLLRRRVVANQRRPSALQPGQGTHYAIPVPGRRGHPRTLAHHRMTHKYRIRRDLRRARCLATGTPGSGGGSRKRAGRKTCTAPRLDPTTMSSTVDRSRNRYETRKFFSNRP